MQQAHMQPQNEPQAETQKNCLTDLTLPKLTDYIKSIGQPAFRAKQIFKWIHQKQATDFSAMTDQPKALLAQFAQNCTLAVPTIRRRQQSKDGTVKYLLQLADGNCIETVLMRYHYGNTVCVSTQVGCAMGCRFCASTQAGRVRDLTSGEIAAEIYTAQKDTGERVSHIVLMGIGEPLHNFDNVMDFLDIISCPEGVNIGMRNISLSTCGLVPGIDKLAERKLQLTLSVSLHAPDNVTRSSMMPVNDAFPLEKLIPACRRYQKTTGRRISFEYSMVNGVNDSPQMAKKLADLIRGMGAHVNLIPINPVDGSPYSATDEANVRRFQKMLEDLGVNATIRRRLGTDISAACGQLRREDAKQAEQATRQTPNTTVMSLMNGVDSEEIIAAKIGVEHVLPSLIKVASHKEADGYHFNPETTIGIIYGELAAPLKSERVQAVEALLAGTGIHSRVTPYIKEEIWSKFRLNVCNNLPQAILGAGVGCYQSSAHMKAISNGLCHELEAIAVAKGIDLSKVDASSRHGSLVPPATRYSTLQDLDAGRHTEIDMFSGALMRMGQELGIPTPYNEYTYHMIKALEEKNDGLFDYVAKASNLTCAK